MIEISIVDSEDGLKCLRDDWNRLLQQSSSDTIFLTWEWMVSWWGSYGTGRTLWILKVEMDNELIGLAPLYKQKFHWFGYLSYSGLYLIGDGSGDSDYLDLIAKVGTEEVVVRSLVEFLLKHQTQWDVFFLNETPSTSGNYRSLRRFFREASCFWQEVEVPCTYVELPSDWEQYLRSLKPRMRTKIRSLTKRLEQDFTVQIDYCKRGDELQAWLESLYKLHGERWQQNGQEGVFISSSKRQFYQCISSLFLTQGWLRFYALTVNGRYVAHQFCFEYRNQLLLLQEGFAPQWERYGVGNVLRAYVFRDCIERKITVYDFLGGVTDHKLSWGGTVKKSIRMAIGLPVIKNSIFFRLPKAIAVGKSTLKALLPEVVWDWVKSLGQAEAFRRVFFICHLKSFLG